MNAAAQHIKMFDDDEIDRDALHDSLAMAILVHFPVGRRDEIARGRGIDVFVESLVEAYMDGVWSAAQVVAQLRREVEFCRGYYMFTPI